MIILRYYNKIKSQIFKVLTVGLLLFLGFSKWIVFPILLVKFVDTIIRIHKKLKSKQWTLTGPVLVAWAIKPPLIIKEYKYPYTTPDHQWKLALGNVQPPLPREPGIYFRNIFFANYSNGHYSHLTKKEIIMKQYDAYIIDWAAHMKACIAKGRTLYC